MEKTRLVAPNVLYINGAGHYNVEPCSNSTEEDVIKLHLLQEFIASVIEDRINNREFFSDPYSQKIVELSKELFPEAMKALKVLYNQELCDNCWDNESAEDKCAYCTKRINVE